MITGAVLLAIITFLGFISYRRRKFEQKVFKNIPLTDWINIMVLPIGMYGAFFLMMRNILSRDNIQVLDLDNMTLGAVGILFMVYAFVGNSIHFVGKVLWRYLPKRKNVMSFQVNEIFHGKLSHYLSYVCSGMVLFMAALLELNHPIADRLSDNSMRMLVIAGMVFGISVSKVIFYTNSWFGGYNKPIFFIVTVLLVTLWAIIKSHELSLLFYPFNTFVLSLYGSLSGTFLARRFMVVTRLSGKKKLGMITRMLSI